MTHKFQSPKFKCPVCGSSEFGSSNCTAKVMQRHCHGCDFECPSTQDWRVFQIPGIRPFANRGEYDLVMDIIRSEPLYAVPFNPE